MNIPEKLIELRRIISYPEQILTIANIFPLHGNRENGFPVLPGHMVLLWSRKTRLDCGLTPAISFKQRKNWPVPA